MMAVKRTAIAKGLAGITETTNWEGVAHQLPPKTAAFGKIAGAVGNAVGRRLPPEDDGPPGSGYPYHLKEGVANVPLIPTRA